MQLFIPVNFVLLLWTVAALLLSSDMIFLIYLYNLKICIALLVVFMFLWLRQDSDLSFISLAVVAHYFCPLVHSKDESKAC